MFNKWSVSTSIYNLKTLGKSLVIIKPKKKQNIDSDCCPATIKPAAYLNF